MDNRRTSRLSIIGLIAAAAALVTALHSLGNTPGFGVEWGDPVAWLDSATAEEAVGALLRHIGLAIGYWLLVSTILYSLTTVSGKTGRSRWVRMMTLPAIRRVVDGALATTLAFSIAATPISSLHAEEPVVPVAVVHEVTNDGIPVPHVRLLVTEEQREHAPEDEEPAVEIASTVAEVVPEPASSTPGTEQIAAVTVPSPLAATASTTAIEAPSATTYAVQNGDNLWTISATHLSALEATEPTVAEIDRYWRSVIAANRTTLRSGDPNLIYPGEMVTLPTLEESP